MATVETWVAGKINAGIGWVTLFNAADLNSLTAGNFVLSTITAIANAPGASGGDIYADFDFILGSITPSAGGYISLYLFPLMHDASSYPGTPTSGATVPPNTYKVADVSLTTSAAVQTGMARGIILPPGTFKVGLVNNSGVNFAASANSAQFRSYDRQFA